MILRRLNQWEKWKKQQLEFTVRYLLVAELASRLINIQMIERVML